MSKGWDSYTEGVSGQDPAPVALPSDVSSEACLLYCSCSTHGDITIDLPRVGHDLQHTDCQNSTVRSLCHYSANKALSLCSVAAHTHRHTDNYLDKTPRQPPRQTPRQTPRHYLDRQLDSPSDSPLDSLPDRHK